MSTEFFPIATGSGGVAGLQFRSQELVQEVNALKGIAGRFLDGADSWVLDQMACGLKRIAGGRANGPQPLELEPLRTKVSRSYERGSRAGGTKIYARMKGKWELRPLQRKKNQPKVVEFAGKASTVVEMWTEGDRWNEDCSNRLAKWRVELGARDSPGCYFHVQVLGDRNEPPFPKSIPIPRLPSLFATPMAAVEFVLGELFQDEWARETSRDLDPQRRWRSLQQDRLCRLLEWQQDLVRQADLSPWMALKDAKPKVGLFWP